MSFKNQTRPTTNPNKRYSNILGGFEQSKSGVVIPQEDIYKIFQNGNGFLFQNGSNYLYN